MYAKSSRMWLGSMGERLACQAFISSGFDVRLHGDSCGDVLVRDLAGVLRRVEVKAARATRSDFKYRFRVRCLGHCDHNKSDFLLLLGIDDLGAVAFLLPCSVVSGLQTITLASHPAKYQGKYSLFRQSLESLSFGRALGAGVQFGRLN